MQTSPKLLVVDNDAVVGRSFDRVLSEKGYEVVTAVNGDDALKRFDEDDYDAVITDIKMPGMDGIEVAERIKQRRPWTPVVIVTGYGTAANQARAEAIGACDFVRKPLSPDMIEGIAQKALRSSETASPRTGSEAVVVPLPVAVEKASALQEVARFSKNVGLLFAAPFVGLAYALALPFVGLAMLVWFGTRALMGRAK